MSLGTGLMPNASGGWSGMTKTFLRPTVPKSLGFRNSDDATREVNQSLKRRGFLVAMRCEGSSDLVPVAFHAVWPMRV